MYKFTGLYESVFSQYKNTETDTTLVAEPGESYSVAPAVPGIPAVPSGFVKEEVVTPISDQEHPTSDDSDGE